MIKADRLVIGREGARIAGPLTFEYPDGHSVMLCGPNGCGKSTLLKTAAGLLRPLSGTFSTGGEVVMLPTHIPKVKGFTVREFLRTSLCHASPASAAPVFNAESSIGDAIQALGLNPLADRDISLISDGEFQKACIAAALCRRANVILLDEPTAFLDVDNRIMVLRTLSELARSTGTTVIFSTHDIHDGARFSDSTLALGAFRF